MSLSLCLAAVACASVGLLATAAVADEYVPAGYAVAPAGALDVANVPAPMFRCPIFDGAADPSVVYVEREKAWYLFYTQRRANVIVQGVGWCYGSQIGIAKSTDQGRTWEYEGVCLGLGRGRQAETLWAPHVFLHDGTFHMIVTYIPRIGGNGKWAGRGRLAHYTSADGEHWKDQGLIDVGSDNIIDPAVIRRPDGKWLLVFRDDNAKTRTAQCVSDDLKTWTRLDAKIGDSEHEGPVMFRFKDAFWMLTDDWQGLGVYKSADLITFERNGRILGQPGKRPEDDVRGGHAGVAVVGDQAFVFYFTHPGRAATGKDSFTSPDTMTHESNRTSIQVAELGVEDGKLVAYRDKYAK